MSKQKRIMAKVGDSLNRTDRKRIEQREANLPTKEIKV